MKCIVLYGRTLSIFVFMMILFLVACSSGSDPESGKDKPVLRIQAFQDRVLVRKEASGGSQEKPILPGESPIDLANEDQIKVYDLGHAQVALSDFLIVDLFRDGDLQVETVTLDEQKQTLLVKLKTSTGAVFSKLSTDEIIKARLGITDAQVDMKTDYSTITVVGTRFLVVKEEHTPLEWIVALEAGESDLFVAADGSSINIPTGKAAWVAPGGPPGPLIDANVPAVLSWINAAIGGTSQPDLGEVVWAPANLGVTASQFPEQLPSGGSFKVHEITVQLDPAGSYERLDCNGDGVLDLHATNGRFRFDLRQVIGQKRAIDVKVTNGNPNLDMVLTGFNPANEAITNVTTTANASAGSAETLKLRSELQPYHFSELIIDDGCFIGIDISREGVPIPTATPFPTTPIATPVATSIPISTIPPCVPNPPANWVLHSVIAGETMYNMAVRTGVSIATIKQANCYFSDAIYVGQLFWLPFNPPTLTPTTTPLITLTNTSTPTIVPTSTSTNIPTITSSPTITPSSTPTPIPRPSNCFLTFESVNSNESVTINVVDAPPTQTFAVTMAPTILGSNGILVGTFDSGNGGDLGLTFYIPEILQQVLEIIIRVQAIDRSSDCGSTSFTNNEPTLDFTVSMEEVDYSLVGCEGEGSCATLVAFIIRNNGSNSYEGILSFEVRLSEGEGTFYSQEEIFVDLPSYGSITATSLLSDPYAACYYYGCTIDILVDSNLAIIESNEENNSASRTFDGPS